MYPFPQTIEPGSIAMAKARTWLLPFMVFLFPFFSTSIAGDTLVAGQSIRDKDGEFLVSARGSFRLGFFSPGASRYVGIWFNNIPKQTVVWVANREKGLTNSAGVLEISDSKDLVLRNEIGGIIWSSIRTYTVLSNTSNLAVQLLDTGNLVLRHETSSSSRDFLWQSFDYPTDTVIPGLKIGWDSKTGLNRNIRSWSSDDDPSPGNCTYAMDLRGSPQLVLKNGMTRLYQTGPWNGIQLSSVIDMSTNPAFIFYFVSNKDEVSVYYENRVSSLISRIVVKPSGVVQTFLWLGQEWKLYWYSPFDQCDNVNICGPYGACNANNAPICHCFQGFEPKNPTLWNLRDGSDGCVRTTPLDCQGDGFLNITRLKLPDTSSSSVNTTMTVDECRAACLKTCSCTAYAPADIRGTGSGCIMWEGDLMDTREFTYGGQSLFLRLAASELVVGKDITRSYGDDQKRMVGILVVSVMLLLGCGVCYIKNKNNCFKTELLGTKNNRYSKIGNEGLEIPLFDLDSIATATNNFSLENKLGEGGFGPVYKGKLDEGQEIAVKRLSTSSGQGLVEFMNEVMLIAKLQHRNLVKLLGCCIHGEERMLIYEYMQNKSLDTFIFDNKKGSLLTWKMRFYIITGISRGLVYLHQDSRLRVIHRDLKASNILLDQEMNPKISDFGTARIFKVDQTKDKTKMVVGTYGYMSPEYVMHGIFSTKSDVFSFGILILEIVTGKSHRGVYEPGLNLTLQGYVWRLWNEGNALKLLDEVTSSCSTTTAEALRCIHVGLLCVQERAVDRPEMASVIVMLANDVMALPPPKRPGFYNETTSDHDELLSYEEESSSKNELSITILTGR